LLGGTLLGVAATTPDTFTKGNMLSALLTTEGLLFAALSISVSLSGSSTFGPKTIIPPTALAFVAAGILSVVAIAAGFAWVDLFAGDKWPAGSDARVEALALLFAIVAQPVIALVIALGIWRG
jgi:hypothetical protein